MGRRTRTSFKKGEDPRRGKGGKRPGAGAPTREELRQRAGELKGLERAKEIIEQKIEEYATRIAERYVTRALEKKADSVLIDAVRKILPEPKQQVDGQHRHITIFETIDVNAERRRKRLEYSKD